MEVYNEHSTSAPFRGPTRSILLSTLRAKRSAEQSEADEARKRIDLETSLWIGESLLGSFPRLVTYCATFVAQDVWYVLNEKYLEKTASAYGALDLISTNSISRERCSALLRILSLLITIMYDGLKVKNYFGILVLLSCKTIIGQSLQDRLFSGITLTKYNSKITTIAVIHN